MMKRYLLFAGFHYYPGGGWEDFEGAYDTVEEALAAGEREYAGGWRHVVDRETLEVVTWG